MFIVIILAALFTYRTYFKKTQKKILIVNIWLIIKSPNLYSYLPTPPLGQDMTQGQFLSGVLQVWIQSFLSPRLVASPRLKNLVCPTILPVAGGRIIGFIPFPRILVQCEMRSISSRIWTRVTVSISYDDNHYTTGTKLILPCS